ncbi:hypothetical protein EI94DRAFT_1705985 [Lactarius quietus]|nr:hypothetical protein EI94DRAFT_1705985 [Lactarius quietus]
MQHYGVIKYKKVTPSPAEELMQDAGGSEGNNCFLGEKHSAPVDALNEWLNNPIVNTQQDLITYWTEMHTTVQEDPAWLAPQGNLLWVPQQVASQGQAQKHWQQLLWRIGVKVFKRILKRSDNTIQEDLHLSLQVFALLLQECARNEMITSKAINLVAEKMEDKIDEALERSLN